MNKKFIESKRITEYEVLTDTGWVDINAVHKTIKYDIWVLKTTDFILKCADKHIVFNNKYKEVFVKDLNVGDLILTNNGIQPVISIEKTQNNDNMYDLELEIDSNKRYYTNNILSHNTTYIRYLIKQIMKNSKDNNILYFPPTMVDFITEPSFINFVSDWVSENIKGKTFLLIEDAEPLLESRNQGRNLGITNLLNLTDGILNDIFNIQIIATFNTRLQNLDQALLRPERLLARKEFKELSIEHSKELAAHLEIDESLINKKMSLAEIYSLKKESEPLTHNIGDSLKIGFSK